MLRTASFTPSVGLVLPGGAAPDPATRLGAGSIALKPDGAFAEPRLSTARMECTQVVRDKAAELFGETIATISGKDRLKLTK